MNIKLMVIFVFQFFLFSVIAVSACRLFLCSKISERIIRIDYHLFVDFLTTEHWAVQSQGR